MATVNIVSPDASRVLTRLIAGIVVSSLTALMLILAFHPYSLWFLPPVALVPMLVAQHMILPEKWSGLAAAVGIGGWLLVFLSSMFRGSHAGLVIQIVVAVIIIIQMFTSPSTRRFHQRTGYTWFLLEGVFSWVGIEMIRSFIPPINTHAFIAQTMYTQPWMLQPISIFGVYGLGLVLILLNFSLAQFMFMIIERKRGEAENPAFTRRRTFSWLAASGIILAAWIGISIAILLSTPKDAPTVRVAAIQHNYPRPGHQDTAESQTKRLAALSAQALDAAGQGAKLIVFPELGLGFDPQVEHTEELRNLAAETKAFLLIGYGLDDPRGWRNEAVMLTPEGQFMEVYAKNHPTSPGEPPIVTAGRYPVYDTPMGRFATIICNDVHWTDSSRILALKGARLISVPTLEAPGIAIEQVAQCVLRAVENRVAIVKADVAYASVIIDPNGNIVALRNGSPDGEAFALVADVPLGTGPTLYSRFGDWTGWLSLAGFIFFVILQEGARRRKKPCLT